METTEKIVEAYVRYVKGWATIPNIKCPRQFEIDLLAIDPVTLDRYHIESMISISGSFSKLTTKPYDPEKAKQRVHAAKQRRTLGYYTERKFGTPEVIQTLEKYGFEDGQYTKIIVTWDVEDGVIERARCQEIEIWQFPQLMAEIQDTIKHGREYYGDDTLRTLHLFDRALRKFEKEK